jgi:hypothetical protein
LLLGVGLRKHVSRAVGDLLKAILTRLRQVLEQALDTNLPSLIEIEDELFKSFELL